MIYIFFNLLHTFDNFKLHEYHIKKRIHAISVFFVRVQNIYALIYKNIANLGVQTMNDLLRDIP